MKISLFFTLLLAVEHAVLESRQRDNTSFRWFAKNGKLFFGYDNKSYPISSTFWRGRSLIARNNAQQICVDVKFFPNTSDINWDARFRFYEILGRRGDNIEVIRRRINDVRSIIRDALIFEWSRASNNIIISRSNGGGYGCRYNVTLYVKPLNGYDDYHRDLMSRCGIACIVSAKNDDDDDDGRTVFLSDRAKYYIFSKYYDKVYEKFEPQYENDTSQPRPKVNLNAILLQLFTKKYWGFGDNTGE